MQNIVCGNEILKIKIEEPSPKDIDFQKSKCWDSEIPDNIKFINGKVVGVLPDGFTIYLAEHDIHVYAIKNAACIEKLTKTPAIGTDVLFTNTKISQKDIDPCDFLDTKNRVGKVFTDNELKTIFMDFYASFDFEV